VVTPVRATRRQFVAVAIGIGMAVVLAVSLLVLPALPHLMFMRQHRRMEYLLDTLPGRRPDAVPERAWTAAVGWARTACVNVCFSREHVALSDMKKFVDSLEKRLSGPVDLDTIHWIWDQLEGTGPHGKRYVADHRPQYRREVEFWEKKGGVAGSK